MEIEDKRNINLLKSNRRKSWLSRYKYYKYKKVLNKKINLKLKKELRDCEIIIEYNSGKFLKDILKVREKFQRIISWIHIDLAERERKRLKDFLKCDKVVTICYEMRDRLIEKIPKLREKIEVVYNPFDIEDIKKKANDLEEISIDDKKLLSEEYMIMVSRLDNQQKDFKTLLKAYSLYKKSGKKAKLYLLGDGEAKAEIELMIKELKLEDEVLLLGSKKNPYPWIKNAKAVILSSKYEGLPTILIEGLILNKKIISSSCPTGPKEILGNGKYGELFVEGDYNMLYKNMNEILTKDFIKTDISKYTKKMNLLT